MASKLDSYERVEVKSRAAWRKWLQKNFERDEGIWLVSYKKHHKHYLAYDDIVDEAIAFGWVDSTTRKVDEDRSALLLSPRRPKSMWSAVNKRRVKRLLKNGLMTPAGQAKIDAAKKDGSWTILDDIEKLVVPPDLEAALKKNKKARESYEAWPPSLKKQILWGLKSAKTDKTRSKRLADYVRLAGKNLRPFSPEAKGQ